MLRLQVTRDWLIMELEDIRLDDETFRDLLAGSANLERHWRPQVAHPPATAAHITAACSQTPLRCPTSAWDAGYALALVDGCRATE